MSGGGAQSALLGATGDAAEYEKYLQEIGAVMTESDAVMGSMDWCPITNLNVADAAYEWELGVARTNLDEKTKAISDGLSKSFAQYINSLGLTDENGTVLTLEQSDDGLYHAGTYYDYLKQTIETSLNNFLSDTSWPYNANEQKSALGQNMMLPAGWVPCGPQGMQNHAPTAEDLDGVNRGKTASGTVDLSGSQPENTLFGLGDGKGLHFDAIMAQVLEETDSTLAEKYKADLAKKDSLGSTMEERSRTHRNFNRQPDFMDKGVPEVSDSSKEAHSPQRPGSAVDDS